MKLGLCKHCRKIKSLTKHSLSGGHLPPFVLLCRLCHDKEHGTIRRRFARNQKGNSKNAIGTRRTKNK
jgi:hypothetical protein